MEFSSTTIGWAAAENTEAPAQLETIATPIRPDYRTLPIDQGFDWPRILSALPLQGQDFSKLYLVVFRSIRREGAPAELITELDAAAHEEAKASPALLHYFAGELDDNQVALSWCLWTDEAAAKNTIRGEAHRRAASHAQEFYDPYIVEMYDTYPLANGQVWFDSVYTCRPTTRPVTHELN